jgi:hypothetical protein
MYFAHTTTFEIKVGEFYQNLSFNSFLVQEAETSNSLLLVSLSFLFLSKYSKLTSGSWVGGM